MQRMFRKECIVFLARGLHAVVRAELERQQGQSTAGRGAGLGTRVCSDVVGNHQGLSTPGQGWAVTSWFRPGCHACLCPESY